MSLWVFWCPDCDLSFEHSEDEDDIGVCPECGSEGELMDKVDDLRAA